tara:strand:+ start:872 stop:1036 length:165 start_codon:yes stop_codon:yes gene_type:complete
MSTKILFIARIKVTTFTIIFQRGFLGFFSYHKMVKEKTPKLFVQKIYFLKVAVK